MFSFLNRWQCRNRVGDRCKSIPIDPSMCLRFRCPNLREIEDAPGQIGKVSKFQCRQDLEGDRRYPKWDNIRDFLGKEGDALKPGTAPKQNRPKSSLWKAVLSLFSL